jgi:hypothetical protein
MLLGSVAVVVGCTAAPAAPAPTTAPTATSAPAAAATKPPSGGGAAPAAARKPGALDMNAIFPPGPGRELVLNNCTNCHSIVPIVTGKKAKPAWDSIKANHLQRVSGMNRDDVNVVFDYLVANFGPNNPEPQLPRELLEAGTEK